MKNNLYPDLEKCSKSFCVPAENLIKAFEIEKVFHKLILEEQSFDRRQVFYNDVYNMVLPLFGRNSLNIHLGKNPKDSTVKLFKKELEGKSVLDVGCGDGYFLASIAKQLKHKELVGIDGSIPPLSKLHKEIQFITSSIIQFDLGQQFDVIFSDQVLEHVAPSDLDIHLRSVYRALKKKGVFIVLLPNKLFGPSDITRIIDNSFSGKINSQGTHLNESTYGELLPILERNGLNNFKTVLPVPKLKYLMKNFRMSPTPLVTIEENAFCLDTLHGIKFNRQCIFKLPIILICSK